MLLRGEVQIDATKSNFENSAPSLIKSVSMPLIDLIVFTSHNFSRVVLICNTLVENCLWEMRYLAPCPSTGIYTAMITNLLKIVISRTVIYLFG